MCFEGVGLSPLFTREMTTSCLHLLTALGSGGGGGGGGGVDMSGVRVRVCACSLSEKSGGEGNCFSLSELKIPFPIQFL